MKFWEMINRKIEIVRQSIKSATDSAYIERLESALAMLLQKKDGTIEKSKPRHMDPDIYRKEKRYRVYRLIYDGDIIYVGITSKTLKQRLDSGYKWLKIDGLIKIELIEETSDFKREEYWIKEYESQGTKLLNTYIPTDIDRGTTKQLGRKEYDKQYGIRYRKKNKK